MISLKHIKSPSAPAAAASSPRISWPGGPVQSNADTAVAAFLRRKLERGEALTDQQTTLLAKFHADTLAKAAKEGLDALPTSTSSGSAGQAGKGAAGGLVIRRHGDAIISSQSGVGSKRRKGQQQDQQQRGGPASSSGGRVVTLREEEEEDEEEEEEDEEEGNGGRRGGGRRKPKQGGGERRAKKVRGGAPVPQKGGDLSLKDKMSMSLDDLAKRR
jgi:hypothetical protein